MRKKITPRERWKLMEQSQAALMREYGATTLCIPEDNRWDYAIPEMYLNYQDGFLMPRFEAYRGMPVYDHPMFGRLYLRWSVPVYALDPGEAEKFLCFNRWGQKFTISILKCPKREEGNPSYFRFLPKVEKYTSKRTARKEATQ